jgi:poly(3-hydroxyalkanoate) synthetase
MPLAFFETLVSMSGGIMPGALIVSGFKLMNAFDRFIGDDMELFQNIEDTQHIERSRRFSEWYDYTQPLGGRMYLDVVAELFQENKLIEGRLEVLGRRVDLGFIYHPIYLVGGTRDDITPPAQLLAIREHVSSTFIQEELVDAGHIGVFMQKKVLNSAWKDIFDRLSRFIPDYSVELNSLESAARCMYN